ncbi:hypothetical protein C8R44DRAFT_823746 [Mycena epipterygia]|nr:hypothetical protein C8R44DRAFT_823746 [Mycena epipterygia]
MRGTLTRGGVLPVVSVQRGHVSSSPACRDVYARRWGMTPGVLFSLTRLITRPS